MSTRTYALFVAITVWAAIAITGAYFVNERARLLDPQPGYVIAQALPRNHLLREEDLDTPTVDIHSVALYLPPRSTFTSRYLITPLEKGTLVQDKLLKRRPDITVEKLNTLVAVTVPAALVDLIDAGSIVDIIAKDRVLAWEKKVEALWCVSSSCYALVQLNEAELLELQKAPSSSVVDLRGKVRP